MNKQIKRVNKKCASFPCHGGIEDCTFCFCPLYPCLNETLGERVFSKKRSEKVWSCKKCAWIHKRDVVDDILRSIKYEYFVNNTMRGAAKYKHMGIVILAHGSKRKDTEEAARKISYSVKRNLKLKHIMPAYLQLCSPNLSEAVRLFAEKGCKQVVIVPYFLFNGNHVARDIPLAIEKEKHRHPEMDFICTRGLSGNDRTMSGIVADIIKEAT